MPTVKSRILINPSMTCLFLTLSIAIGINLASLHAAEPRVGAASADTTARAVISDYSPEAATLRVYRAELTAFRGEFGGARALPDVRFFLFGMGQRTKLLYRGGRLTDARSGKLLREWKVKSDMIVPSDYLVRVETADGATVRLREDETAVWIEEGSTRTAIEGTRHPVKLPDFTGHRYARILRVLHQELLVNVTPAGPVPNLFVYSKPWYRDGAMMALAFRETGNLDQIRDWVLGLKDVFDRNNGGETEADNPGQALFLISLVADKSHPLVPDILAAVKAFETNGPAGRFIQGRSDFAAHPAYQTKWLKYGLRSLGLPDPYVIPAVADSYSALFWMDYRDTYVKARDSDDRGAYPYLGWAVDHFHATKLSPIGNRDYPLTWEERASQANYAGLSLLDEIYATQKISTPHTWHAAEMFLYVLKLTQPAAPSAAKPSSEP